MTSIAHVASVALGAQRRLHGLSCAERLLRGQGRLSNVAACCIGADRAAEQSRMAVCSEFFAVTVAANDTAFQPTPEHA